MFALCLLIFEPAVSCPCIARLLTLDEARRNEREGERERESNQARENLMYGLGLQAAYMCV